MGITTKNFKLKKIQIKGWFEMVQNNPSSNKLLHLKKKIEDEIVKRCGRINGVRKVNASLKITWKNGSYFIGGDVKVEIEKGLTNPNLIQKSVENEISNIVKEHIPTGCSLKIK